MIQVIKGKVNIKSFFVETLGIFNVKEGQCIKMKLSHVNLIDCVFLTNWPTN